MLKQHSRILWRNISVFVVCTIVSHYSEIHQIRPRSLLYHWLVVILIISVIFKDQVKRKNKDGLDEQGQEAELRLFF